MPMIRNLLNELYQPKRVFEEVEGFNCDTAVAIGAALYGRYGDRVRDVSPKTYGIRYMRGTESYIRPFVRKDTPLPAAAEDRAMAPDDAYLEVFEGESPVPEECRFLGKLELGNPAGEVTVRLEVEEHGLIRAAARWRGTDWKALIVRDPRRQRDDELREKIQAVELR